MSNIVTFKKPGPTKKSQGNTLCRRGFHKWQAVAGTPFDVKAGRLVTRFRCQRCGAERTEAT
jgi:hypothetical protein